MGFIVVDSIHLFYSTLMRFHKVFLTFMILFTYQFSVITFIILSLLYMQGLLPGAKGF